MVQVPYLALTPELEPDYDARTTLSAYRVGFGVLASLLAVALPPVIIASFGTVIGRRAHARRVGADGLARDGRAFRSRGGGLLFNNGRVGERAWAGVGSEKVLHKPRKKPQKDVPCGC